MLSTPALFQGNARRWRIAPPTPAADAALVGNGLPPLAAHLLARRGIVTEPSATDFMGVSERLFEDPAALPHIDEAISRLRLARERGETVAVYGDFDADGVTGTALAVKALTRFGVRAISYIPHRVSEGHGLNNAAVDTLRERGAELIITVDCGVTDVGPVAYARNHGVDTIITDHHHVPDGDLP
ncbi:MAG: DHH family phosphoesterase, partial [Chloroflexota bacterium]